MGFSRAEPYGPSPFTSARPSVAAMLTKVRMYAGCIPGAGLPSMPERLLDLPVYPGGMVGYPALHLPLLPVSLLGMPFVRP